MGERVELAPEIFTVATAQGPAVHLSEHRNEQVPSPLRTHTGLYVGDQLAIPRRVFVHELGLDVAETDDTLRAIFPDSYARATGASVERRPGPDLEQIRAAFPSAYVTQAPPSEDSVEPWAPQGWSAISARHVVTGQEGRFLVPALRRETTPYVVGGEALDVSAVVEVGAQFPLVDDEIGELRGQLARADQALVVARERLAQFTSSQPRGLRGLWRRRERELEYQQRLALVHAAYSNRERHSDEIVAQLRERQHVRKSAQVAVLEQVAAAANRRF